MHLACRHHVLELLAGTAFTTLLGRKKGPDVFLFKRFQDQWSFIDKDAYKNATYDKNISNLVKDPDLAEWAVQALQKEKSLREDYREFVELALVFMGVTPPRGVRFMAPGPMHHARWMAKVIYSLKIWLFRHQFKMTAIESKGIQQMSIFAVKIYLKAWIQAPRPALAPKNDLELLKSLVAYEDVNPAVSKAVLEKILSHLWYLSEELVVLAFFDSSVTFNVKILWLKKQGSAKD